MIARLVRLTAILLLVGCTGHQSSLLDIDGAAVVSATNLTGPRREYRGIEMDFEDISNQVPAFSGYYYDDTGALVLSLTDLSQEGAARAMIATSKILPFGSAVARTRKVEHTFLQLKTWRDEMTWLALDIPGVAFVDLDEEKNRLTVGLESANVQANVEALLHQLDIPIEATTFEVSGPIVLDTLLTDRVRPVVGGLSINRPFGGSCTLGFNAIRASVNVNVWVTNSHCTRVRFGSDGSDPMNNFFQGGEFIGSEYWDRPAYECPVGTNGSKCRASDAALILRTGVSYSLGRIATTIEEARWPDASSPIIIQSTSRYRITVEASNPVVGDWIHKVGKTTGWTSGPVTRTCVDASQSGTTVRLFCQDFAKLGIAGGDSGSPVFKYFGEPVTLVGILWGGPNQSDEAVLSSMANIEFDYGNLITF